MTRREKQALWGLYPEVWGLFVDFNGITLEDDAAWSRLADRAHQIGDMYGIQEVRDILTATVDDLDKIARKRRGCG